MYETLNVLILVASVTSIRWRKKDIIFIIKKYEKYNGTDKMLGVF